MIEIMIRMMNVKPRIIWEFVIPFLEIGDEIFRHFVIWVIPIVIRAILSSFFECNHLEIGFVSAGDAFSDINALVMFCSVGVVVDRVPSIFKRSIPIDASAFTGVNGRGWRVRGFLRENSRLRRRGGTFVYRIRLRHLLCRRK